MDPKVQMVRLIRRRALAEAEFLSGEFVRAASEEKEDILAALEYEKWLAEACLDALPDEPDDYS